MTLVLIRQLLREDAVSSVSLGVVPLDPFRLSLEEAAFVGFLQSSERDCNLLSGARGVFPSRWEFPERASTLMDGSVSQVCLFYANEILGKEIFIL